MSGAMVPVTRPCSCGLVMAFVFRVGAAHKSWRCPHCDNPCPIKPNDCARCINSAKNVSQG